MITAKDAQAAAEIARQMKPIHEKELFNYRIERIQTAIDRSANKGIDHVLDWHNPDIDIRLLFIGDIKKHFEDLGYYIQEMVGSGSTSCYHDVSIHWGESAIKAKEYDSKKPEIKFIKPEKKSWFDKLFN